MGCIFSRLFRRQTGPTMARSVSRPVSPDPPKPLVSKARVHFVSDMSTWATRDSTPYHSVRRKCISDSLPANPPTTLTQNVLTRMPYLQTTSEAANPRTPNCTLFKPIFLAPSGAVRHNRCPPNTNHLQIRLPKNLWRGPS